MAHCDQGLGSLSEAQGDLRRDARRLQVPGNASFRTLAGLARCEAIARGPRGDLWAGDSDGIIYRIADGSSEPERLGRASGAILGLCLDRQDGVYLCLPDVGRVERFDPRTQEVATYCGTVDGSEIRMPNWPVFGPDGILYVSDSGMEDLGDRSGRIAAIAPGGGDGRTLVPRPLGFPNGLALAPGGRLFIAESFAQRILVRTPDGKVDIYRELPGVIPDGLALDQTGGLIVACFQPNRVLRIPPDSGPLEILVDDWTGIRLLTPTNVAFFGPELRELAIASLCGWSISAITYPGAGLPLYYPDITVAGIQGE